MTQMRSGIVPGALAPAGLVVVLVATAHGAVPYTDTWDAGSTDGWSGLHVTTPTAPVSGGNPAGFLRLTSPIQSLTVRSTKAQLTGDYAGAAIDGIRLDVRSPDAVHPDLLSIEFRAQVPGGILTALCNLVGGLADDPPTTWTTFDMPFDASWTTTQAQANGWLVDDTSGNESDATWGSLFADVQAVTITALRSDGGAGLEIGVDNFRLVPPAPAGALGVPCLWAAIRRRR